MKDGVILWVNGKMYLKEHDKIYLLGKKGIYGILDIGIYSHFFKLTERELKIYTEKILLAKITDDIIIDITLDTKNIVKKLLPEKVVNDMINADNLYSLYGRIGKTTNSIYFEIKVNHHDIVSEFYYHEDADKFIAKLTDYVIDNLSCNIERKEVNTI